MEEGNKREERRTAAVLGNGGAEMLPPTVYNPVKEDSMIPFVTHLEGAIDGTRLPPGKVYTLHNDRPIWVRYDLPAIAKAVRRDEIAGRPPGMWRYARTAADRTESRSSRSAKA